MSTMSATARLGTGWLATPRTLPLLFLAGHGLVAAAFTAWALAGPAIALPVLTGVAVLFGVGYGAWLSLAPAILAATTDPRHLGRTLGTHAMAVGTGGVVGPVLASPLLAAAPRSPSEGALRSPSSPLSYCVRPDDRPGDGLLPGADGRERTATGRSDDGSARFRYRHPHAPLPYAAVRFVRVQVPHRLAPRSCPILSIIIYGTVRSRQTWTTRVPAPNCRWTPVPSFANPAGGTR